VVTFVCSFFAGRGPAYSLYRSNAPAQGEEGLVGVYGVCASCVGSRKEQ